MIRRLAAWARRAIRAVDRWTADYYPEEWGPLPRGKDDK